MRMEIKNPCIGKCKYDDKGVCTGCDRTREEIVGWDSFSEQKKREILKKIVERNTIIENDFDFYV